MGSTCNILAQLTIFQFQVSSILFLLILLCLVISSSVSSFFFFLWRLSEVWKRNLSVLLLSMGEQLDAAAY